LSYSDSKNSLRTSTYNSRRRLGNRRFGAEVSAFDAIAEDPLNNTLLVEPPIDDGGPFGVTVKVEKTGLDGSIYREVTSTGRPVQFDQSYGRIYGCKKLGDLDEVPVYRWDGGYRDRQLQTPKKDKSRMIEDRSTAGSRTLYESYYA
jgi:hypothetical protein